MLRKKIYMHIGYPKTATTTIQECISRHLRDTHFYLNENSNFTNFIWQLIYAPEINVSKYLTEYSKSLAGILNEIESDTLIFSEESILSLSLFARPTHLLRPELVDPFSILRKFSLVFSDCGLDVVVLFGIRRQEEILKSVYAQFYRVYFSRFRSSSNFESWINKILGQENSDYLSHFSYFHLYVFLGHLFGHENIKVLVFENLIEDKESFLNKVEKSFEVELINRAGFEFRRTSRTVFGGLQYSEARRVSELLPDGRLKSFGKLIQAKAPRVVDAINSMMILPRANLGYLNYSNEHLGRLKQEFGPGNQRLSEELRLNLEDFGYLFR